MQDLAEAVVCQYDMKTRESTSESYQDQNSACSYFMHNFISCLAFALPSGNNRHNNKAKERA